MNITSDDYSKAIKSRYEQVKNSLHTEHLINPSPAQLRKLCMVLYENGLNDNDDKIFRKFFYAKEEDNLEKIIEQVSLNRFRAIQNFLCGDAKTNILENLNLIAVLIDFSPRPLRIFLKQYREIENSIEIIPAPSIDVPNTEKEANEIDTPKINYDNNSSSEIEQKNVTKTDESFIDDILMGVVVPENIIKIKPPTSTKTKRLILASALVITLLSGFATKAVYFSNECMQWQGYQYVCVDCDKEITKEEIKVVPFEENTFKLKKLNVNNKTIFFDKDTHKPLVWYSKQNKKMEYFNAPGLHPVTGKTLKEISPIIIKYHVDTIKKPEQIVKLAER